MGRLQNPDREVFGEGTKQSWDELFVTRNFVLSSDESSNGLQSIGRLDTWTASAIVDGGEVLVRSEPLRKLD